MARHYLDILKSYAGKVVCLSLPCVDRVKEKTSQETRANGLGISGSSAQNFDFARADVCLFIDVVGRVTKSSTG